MLLVTIARTVNQNKTWRENVGEGKDGYLKLMAQQTLFCVILVTFLFHRASAYGSKSLFGGERNRVCCMAKLFTRSSNLLIMDEATNDP